MSEKLLKGTSDEVTTNLRRLDEEYGVENLGLPTQEDYNRRIYLHEGVPQNACIDVTISQLSRFHHFLYTNDTAILSAPTMINQVDHDIALFMIKNIEGMQDEIKAKFQNFFLRSIEDFESLMRERNA